MVTAAVFSAAGRSIPSDPFWSRPTPVERFFGAAASAVKQLGAT
jgi:hypothetical protein